MSAVRIGRAPIAPHQDLKYNPSDRIPAPTKIRMTLSAFPIFFTMGMLLPINPFYVKAPRNAAFHRHSRTSGKPIKCRLKLRVEQNNLWRARRAVEKQLARVIIRLTKKVLNSHYLSRPISISEQMSIQFRLHW